MFFFILSAAVFERFHPVQPPRLHRFLGYFGSLSFSIYVLHVPLLYATKRFYPAAEALFRLSRYFLGDGTSLPYFSLILLCLFLITLVLLADLSFRFVETPLKRLIKRKFSSRT
jgi:peptidoglycan/LPS O-acetylase OafA/YrhL